MGSKLLEMDTQGFAQVFADRPLHRMIEELVSNTFDERPTTCDVKLEHVENQDYRLVVTDDSPAGFAELSDSYTLFAPSKKKGDPEKRGRFCFGEKWVIVRCKQVRITSTTGTVLFDVVKDERRSTRQKTEKGTVVECLLRSTREQAGETCRRVFQIIPPQGVRFTFNGNVVEARQPLASFEAKLPTVVPNDEGGLTKTARNTRIDVYEPLPGEQASIYEVGIPIQPTGDLYHVDVRQRVPLGLKRNVVKDGYLRLIRGLVLTHTAHLIPAEKINNRGVKDGLATASPAAVAITLDKLVGVKRFIQDNTDVEAENNLKSQGYVQMSGGMFDAETWTAIKAAGAAKPAGVILPTPKPYGGGTPAKRFDDKAVTDNMTRFRRFAELVCRITLGKSTCWTWIDEPKNCFWLACCGPIRGAGGTSISIDFNVGRLGVKWFDEAPATSVKMVDLLIHELGHHEGHDHLTKEYHDQITRIGAKLAVAMLAEPQQFKQYR